MEELDWRWLRSFVAVADEGGMLAASQKTGISQPTLSRHIKLLEESLGVALFDRSGRGVVLSPRGAELFERAKEIHEKVKAFERQAAGLAQEEAGSVRVTMTEIFGYCFAPQWLCALRQEYPHITVDLLAEDQAVNLLLREAEIAVRMFRPTQLDLLTKYCGQQALGFFASPEYWARRPAPQTLQELMEHDLVGFDRLTDWIEYAAQMGFSYTRQDFVFRCDSQVLQLRAAQEGLGIAVLPDWLGEQEGLVRALGEVEMEGMPIYLVAHPDLHQNPRLLRVWEHLGEALRRRFMR